MDLDTSAPVNTDIPEPPTGSGGVTSVTGTAPIASSGGTTPAISLNDAGVTPAKLSTAARRQSRLCRIDVPVSGNAYQVVGIPEAATIKAVRHIHVGGTSVTFNIEHRAEATPFTTSATVVWSSVKTTSSTSTEETSFDDATVASSIMLTVVIGTVTGVVTNMLVVIEFEVD